MHIIIINMYFGLKGPSSVSSRTILVQKIRHDTLRYIVQCYLPVSVPETAKMVLRVLLCLLNYIGPTNLP
jgi:hypothetical protein